MTSVYSFGGDFSFLGGIKGKSLNDGRMTYGFASPVRFLFSYSSFSFLSAALFLLSSLITSSPSESDSIAFLIAARVFFGGILACFCSSFSSFYGFSASLFPKDIDDLGLWFGSDSYDSANEISFLSTGFFLAPTGSLSSFN